MVGISPLSTAIRAAVGMAKRYTFRSKPFLVRRIKSFLYWCVMYTNAASNIFSWEQMLVIKILFRSLGKMHWNQIESIYTFRKDSCERGFLSMYIKMMTLLIGWIIGRQNVYRVTMFNVLHDYNDEINVNRIYFLHIGRWWWWHWFLSCDQIERKVCGLSVTIALNFSLTLLSKQLSIFIFFKLLNLLTIFAEAISVFLITESS